LERRGIVTASVTMMPEITGAIRVPRALVMSSGLGRPFGAPADPEHQSAVLRALLALCARTDVPLIEAFGPQSIPS
jgi:hypothetical protein